MNKDSSESEESIPPDLAYRTSQALILQSEGRLNGEICNISEFSSRIRSLPENPARHDNIGRLYRMLNEYAGGNVATVSEMKNSLSKMAEELEKAQTLEPKRAIELARIIQVYADPIPSLLSNSQIKPRGEYHPPLS